MDSNVALSTRARPAGIWLLTAGAFFAFFVFGFVDNVKGPALPNLLRDLELSYSMGGGILLGAYLGFVIATLTTGPLADATGNRTVLLLAGLFIGTGIVGFTNAGTFPMLFGSMMVIGLGAGAIEVGGNGLIVEMHRSQQGRFLNLLAVFHGVGSLIAPLYAAWLLNNGFGWRQVFLYVLPLVLVLVLIFVVTPGPSRERNKQGGFDWTVVRRTGFSPTMLLFYTAIALYVAAELGIGAWIVEYLIQVKGFALGTASLFLSGFFGAIMVGRLLGSFVVERIGYLPATIMAVAAAATCIAVGLMGPPILAIFLPVSGFFFSIVFPTITAAVSARHPLNTGTMLGLLFAAGGFGGALGPWGIGVASDVVGITWGFALVGLYMAGAMVTLLALRGRLAGETASG